MDQNTLEETPEKQKKKGSGVFVSIVILLIFLAGGGMFFTYYLGSHKQAVNKKEEAKAIEITSEMKQLIKTIPENIIFTGNDNKDYFVYRKKKVSVTDVPSEVVIQMAIDTVPNSKKELNYHIGQADFCNYIVPLDVLKGAVQELYGDVSYEEVEKTSNIYKDCKKMEKGYCCKTKGGITQEPYDKYFHTPLYYHYGVRQIVKAEEDSNYLYLYEKFAYYQLSSLDQNQRIQFDKSTFKLYKYSDSDELVEKEDLLVRNYYNTGGSFYEEILEKHMDDMVTYKHIFQKSDSGTFQWISTEPIK